MTAATPEPAPGGAPKPRPLAVLFGASATQAAAAIGFWSFALLAPELARETGQSARDFGLAVSFIFLGTFFSSPFTGALVARFGGMGTLALVLAAMALALLLNLAALWAATMLSAFLFGLAYGPQAAVGMTLVTQSAPRRVRGLFLALRHAAVPAAAALTGRLLPPLMLLLGWRLGVVSLSAALFAAVAFTLLAGRLFRLGGAGRARVAAGVRGPWAALRERFRVPRHLRFLWGAGLVFAATQTSVTFFSYLYLLEVIGLGPVAAGIFASNLHLTALFGRPLLGWLCDRTGNAQVVLAGIAMVTVVTIVALLGFGPDSPSWLLIPLALACGVSGQCWNSVFVTAMSFKVEDADLAEMNGRAFSFLSLGWMSSALVFWGLIELSGGYQAPFLLVAALNVAVAGVLLFGGERR